MESSTGRHYPALDHLRALAAFMVFAWHFMHGANGYPLPFSENPAFAPLALFDEGHVGVALFMTLSGYLFAKLTYGKRLSYTKFLFNRILRLLPLLSIVIFTPLLWHHANNTITPQELFQKLNNLFFGFIYPLWPNGAWSIAVELQFYFIFPFLLLLQRRSVWWLVMTLLGAIALRTLYHHHNGQVQQLAYLTLIGRIDQFILGIIFYQWQSFIIKRKFLVLLTAAILIWFYSWFNAVGGFYNYPAYPSSSAIWIFIPTIEGLCFAILIAWYDGRKAQAAPSKISRAIAHTGKLSYSIYLLHFFVVFWIADNIHRHLFSINNPYIALAAALCCYLALLPLFHLSYTIFERPFLKFRKPYLIETSISTESNSQSQLTQHNRVI